MHIGNRMELHIPRLSPSSASPKASRPAKPRTLASLFGGNRGTTVPSTSAKQAATDGDNAVGLAASPMPNASTGTIAVVAWPIESVLSGKKLAKNILHHIEQRTRSHLRAEDSRIVDLTIRFLHRFNATVNAPPSPMSKTEERKESDAGGSTSLLGSSIDDVTSAVQEFLYDVQLRLEQAEQERAALADAMQEDNEKEASTVGKSANIDQSLENVEAYVCDMVYDRIFSPLQASDRQDDESLSTRIAGLHMLDLTLDHLGFRLDTTNSSPDEINERRILQDGIDDIVKQCGLGA